MDDDGLQLNFAFSDQLEPPRKRRKVVAQKESWKARVKRQQIADARTNQRAVDKPVQPVVVPARTPTVTVAKSDEPTRKPTAARRSIISSLFSASPVLPTDAVSEEPRTPGKPSNAPADGTFVAVGLTTALVEVLQGPKLGLQRPTPIQSVALPLLLSAGHAEDTILQAQTGSGKTLAYLLPIVQDLMAIGEMSAQRGRVLERSSGTMAIILVPTRELANQIYETAQLLLSSRNGEGHSHRWLTPGLLSGGMHRQHEKARLRKGLPLLIATPGRLIDHLTSTSSFRLAGEASHERKKQPAATNEDEFHVEDNPSKGAAGDTSDSDDFDKPTSRSYRPKFADQPHPALTLRWLVLDEADRLMDMGFEPQIKQILDQLAKRLGPSRARRRTILCSATMQDNVRILSGLALRSPRTLTAAPRQEAGELVRDRPAPPSQLVQSYCIVPPKLRFVALVALLRRLFARDRIQRVDGNKALVFVSCTASVDLLWTALGGLKLGSDAESDDDDDDDEDKVGLSQHSAVLPGLAIYRLHGNLDLATRLAALKGFAAADSNAVLICTSVAARGLDVPFVRSVVQYDLPTEGGATEYIHRVGRTARAGRAGEAWALLLPSESDWAPWVDAQMSNGPARTTVSLQSVGVEHLLQSGFGGDDYHTRATDVQMAFERWTEQSGEHTQVARDAFLSHLRAYATHPSDEKHLFHVRNLHLGHLAKSFGLREAPSDIKAAPRGKKFPVKAEPENSPGRDKQPRTGRALKNVAIRPAQADASEFAISGGDEVERMLAHKKKPVR